MIGSRNCRFAGVSLIEVLVAVSIAAVTVIAAISLLASEWLIIRKTEESLHINRILSSRLEEIRDLTFDELEELPGSITFVPQPALTVFGKAINPEVINLDYQVDLHDAFGQVIIEDIRQDLKRVTVIITWNIAGRERQAEMRSVTYITRNGVTRV